MKHEIAEALQGKSIVASHASLERAAKAYGEVLEKFCLEHELPSEWFAHPDHLAVKCADRDHYRSVVEQAKPYSREMTEVPLNGRFLATAKLADMLSLGKYGEIDWLEIMEPRPEMVGVDVVGVDHAEFYFADFETVIDELDIKNISFECQSNPAHAWVSFQIADNLELKLNDAPLDDVVEHELAEKTARIIWQRGRR